MGCALGAMQHRGLCQHHKVIEHAFGNLAVDSAVCGRRLCLTSWQHVCAPVRQVQRQ